MAGFFSGAVAQKRTRQAQSDLPEKPKPCTVSVALNRKPSSGLAAETTTKENYLHLDSMLSARDATRVDLLPRWATLHHPQS